MFGFGLKLASVVGPLWLGATTSPTVGVTYSAAYRSPVSVAADADGQRLFVAESGCGEVAMVDVPSARVVNRFRVPGAPMDLTLSRDGATLYVACAGASGQVLIIDAESGKVRRAAKVGYTPMAPTESADGRRLFVCNRFDNEVVAIDGRSGRHLWRTDVPREPVAAALSPDSAHLFVANHLPAGAFREGDAAADVSVINAASGKLEGEIRLLDGSTAVRDICISPDGKFAYVSHILAHYQVPTTQLERGWMNTSAVTIIDVAQRKRVNTVLLDDVTRGSADPWGIACTPDGRWLCVACSGVHQLCVIDRPALHKRLEDAAAGKRVTETTHSAEDVSYDLAFTYDIKRRVRLPGRGPRGIATAEGRVFAAQYFSGSVAAVDLNSKREDACRTVGLGPQPEPTVERRGEMLFHDATICFQHWQSCASCHPDVRADALNWDLLNDGLGNPKQTKNLLLAHRTPPAMVTGIRADAETAVRAGLRFALFAVRPESEAEAIDAFLKSLKPTPSPRLVDGKLSPAAQRGQRIFSMAACSHCHAPPLYTNQESYDVGTGTGREKGMAFDTPTLMEAWRTAPYLHDGRAATIAEVLTKFNPRDVHGQTSHLTRQQLQDLVAFVESL